MSRPSTPELARRIVDRVIRALEQEQVLDPVWYSEYGERFLIRKELLSLVEKELEKR